MSQAPYQLLLRHPELFTANTLVLTAEADFEPQWLTLVRQQGSKIHSWDWACARQAKLALAAEQVTFGVPATELPDNTERVILVWPKSKVLATALVQLLARTPAHRYLPELWVVGANDTGGKSIGNALKALADCEKQDTARHCSFWSALLKPQTDSFNWLKLAKPTHHDGKDYLSLPGVFSQGSLDKGTALLLQHLPELKGRVLDLGCGCGVIGLSKAAPAASLVMADVDAMALQSAALNSTRMGIAATTVASDGFSDIDGKFDVIVSNPPFHTGKQTDYHVAMELLSQSRAHLKAGGSLWLVANRHLPYEEWAQQYFPNIDMVAHGQAFKVLKFSY
ncbi:class I SAM-dependent methyltransferase [Oceanobacter mangrovi]|uniref:class I SAM-dependent methyltransferase n=1 Tax=Oceanobacter mangrovi TaxID=2862510 RepID=UPI001C8D8D1A|nr:class I SAM-dependent methyltransferase [Oceanobacter mangrovi]